MQLLKLYELLSEALYCIQVRFAETWKLHCNKLIQNFIMFGKLCLCLVVDAALVDKSEWQLRMERPEYPGPASHTLLDFAFIKSKRFSMSPDSRPRQHPNKQMLWRLDKQPAQK